MTENNAVRPDDDVSDVATAAISPMRTTSQLAPLNPDLEPDVRTFVQHVRDLFALTEMSVRRYAALHKYDPGTISRYLNGVRLPSTQFLDSLQQEVASRGGAPVTEQVQEQTHTLYLAALRARSPSTYELQRAIDKARACELALRESELMVAALKEAVATRESRLHETEMARRALAAAAAAERLDNAEEHAARDAERQRLIEEITQLQCQLGLALRSRDRALAKVRRLEEELTALEDNSSSVVDSPDLREAREVASRIIADARREAEAIKALPIRAPRYTVGPRPFSEAQAAARLRALANFAKSMAAAHSVDDVISIAAREAQRDLRAAVASISMWEGTEARLRVLASHGELARGESAFPENERWPVTAFPELVLSEEDIGPWIQLADEAWGDPLRVAMLRKRRRNCALIAPITYNGRAWGELCAARTSDQPPYGHEDMDFAAALAAQIAAGLAKEDHVRKIELLTYAEEPIALEDRHAFDVRLDAAVNRHASDGTVVSLIACRVVWLTQIVDRIDRGDAGLVPLARVIKTALPPRSIAAQYGHREFCILIEGHRADVAVSTAEKLCMRVQTVIGRRMACGVASTGERIGDVTTSERLLRLAHTARYHAERTRSLHPVVAGRGSLDDLA